MSAAVPGGGGGTLNASQAMVTVTATSSAVDVSSVAVSTEVTTVETTITGQQVAMLPKGTNFTSLLKMQPGFQIDGTSGSENTFVIDGAEVTNFRTGNLNRRSEGPVFGRAEVVAEPVYSEDLVRRKISGKVEVAVTVNRFGIIETAKATSGPKELREAAEAAAMLSKFSAPLVDKKPVRLKGIMVYEFTPGSSVTVKLKGMTSQPLTAAESRELKAGEKLHTMLFRLLSETASDTDKAYMKDGKVEITVNAKKGIDIQKLTKAGMSNIQPAGNGRFTGTIEVNRLAHLTDIGDVKLVLPRF